MPLDQGLQGRPLASHDGDRLLDAGHLRLHPTREGVVIQDGRDGPDYATVCARHQWGSPWGPDISCCPACVAENDDPRGRVRYAAITMRLGLGL